MLKIYVKKLLLGIAFLCVGQFAYSQTKLSGNVTDGTTKEALIGVSVQVKGKVIGTITDSKGNFSLSTSTPTPFTLVISSVGYQPQEVNITGDNSSINIVLEEQTILGQEVVVAASRMEEKVMRSPVAVEKLDIRAIKETPSSNFYDAIANLKGVDMTTQGLLFKSVNMRGFNATGNPRTVQMIDGMDNSAPGLNFPVDNIVGMPELDVESVEVLPGAASALYGPNAINGLILMNSKSPFLYQGFSGNVKTGVMSASNRDTKTTPFYDLSFRYAKAFNNKTAFKINLAYIGAQDWAATDYTNLNLGGVQDGTRGAGVNPDYDGMNTYGDEVQSNMQTVANGLIAARLLPAAALALVPNTNVSRTGFFEKDLVDYNTKSLKANFALHHRFSEKVEFVAQVNYGFGTTVYTGTGRYSLRNFNITQAKAELRGDNFTLRAYTTQERSGDSYTAGLQAVTMLDAIKPHETWFGQYVGAFVQARSAGQAEAQAHLTARAAADAGMPTPGTAAFETLRDIYREKTISGRTGGGAFLDKSNMYHAEGVYNFKNQVKFMELMMGANVRQYQLRSEKTLFADTGVEGRDGSIGINEFGGFVQAGKSLFKDHFKVTASIRYDKNQNFEGQYTPRISGVATFGEQNIRLSYQTGFRIPTTQNQYIDLFVPGARLIGGLAEFNSRYNLANGILRDNLATSVIQAKIASDPSILVSAQQYATAAVNAQLPAITAGVTAAVNAQRPTITAGVTAVVQAQVTTAVTAQVNAAVAAGQLPASQAQAAIAAGVAQTMSLSSTQQTIQTNVNTQVASLIQSNITSTVTSEITKATAQVVPAFALAKLPKYQPKVLQPERISSIEVGYKGLIAKKLFIDAYYYESKYTNFIGGAVIIVPTAAAAPGLPIESGAASASTRNVFSRPANRETPITVNGWAMSANYLLPKGFNIGFNVANNQIKGGFVPTPEVQFSGFNTPKYRYNLTFGKRLGSGDKYGFSIAYRYQDSYLYEGGFMQPTTTGIPLFSNTTVPAVKNLDAQVSFKLSKMKSILKVGGTNLFGNNYIQAFGSSSIGQMYYVSLLFDGLLNK